MVRKQSLVVCVTAPLSVQRSAPSTGGFGFAHNTAVTLQYSKSLAPSPQPQKEQQDIAVHYLIYKKNIKM